METIEIKRNGETVSRVVFARAVSDFAETVRACGQVFMVYDMAVEPYASGLEALCPNIAGKYAIEHVSEECKTMETALDICRWLLGEGADRKSAVLAVGGGIVSDMAGFAASVYKRGIRALYLPTTLLSQVDASIGGKTGVNLDSYKNIVGTFRQPEYTFVCPEVLGTLPQRTFADGLAEMLKTFIIDNGPEGDRVERMMSAVEAMYADEAAGAGFDKDMPDRESGSRVRMISDDFGILVAEAASVKAGIVSRDELESGERRKLNLGHTFAHAIEYCANSGSASAVSGKPGNAGNGTGRQCTVSHGEAVAIGLSVAGHLSESLGIARKGTAGRIDRCLDICGLPRECPFPFAMLEEAMCKDKKSEGGKVHFILVGDIGDVTERLLDVPEVMKVLSGQGRDPKGSVQGGI